MPCDETLKWTTVVFGAGFSDKAKSTVFWIASGPVRLSVSIDATYNTLHAVETETSQKQTNFTRASFTLAIHARRLKSLHFDESSCAQRYAAKIFDISTINSCWRIQYRLALRAVGVYRQNDDVFWRISGSCSRWHGSRFYGKRYMGRLRIRPVFYAGLQCSRRSRLNVRWSLP